MIVAFGRQLPLPARLQLCPSCQRGELLWTGTAYRCTHTTTRTDGSVKYCRHVVSLAAIFDDEGLSTKLQLGPVDVTTLTLTRYALEMLMLGVMAFDWMPIATVARLHADLPVQEEESQEDVLDRLIRERLWAKREGAPQ